MLLCKDRGRNEKGALLAVHCAFERSSERDLGLAVADIAAKKAVHDSVGFHVALYLLDARQLIGGLLVGEAQFKPLLPIGIRGKGIASNAAAFSVELHKVEGKLLNALTGAVDGLLPFGRAELGELQLFLVTADVFLYPVELVGRDIDFVAALIEKLDIILGCAERGEGLNPGEPADTVYLMDDGIPGLQFHKLKLRLFL